jgi:hypothetical protein
MQRVAKLVMSLGVVAGLIVVGPGVAPAAWASAADPSSTVWLCRPHLPDNPCAADRTATAVAADGSTRTERPRSAKRRPVDCFYIYPTVSLQPTVNANFDIDPNETNVAIAQASRYSSVCRVYAPIYRQLTLRAIGGGATAQAAALAYGDVRNAWRDYLAHDNHGRGVVLIGHSQGAGMLNRLIRDEIDPKQAARRKLVSALLLGGNVLVPPGRDVGGDFKHIPACRKAKQTGCVVAYSTFQQTPPADAIFGRVDVGFNRVRGASSAASDFEVLCVNPGALAGGESDAHAYFPAHLPLGVLGGALPKDALTSIPTPWVTYPGLFKVECRNEGGASWLQVNDQRAFEPDGGVGDVRPKLVDSLGPGWGLHLADANITAGDLVQLVGRQAAAYDTNR